MSDTPSMEGATERPWGMWSEEGKTKTGRYRHSVCANGTELRDGELQVAGEEGWHKCVADVLGDSEAEALANAALIVAAVNAYNPSRDAHRAERPRAASTIIKAASVLDDLTKWDDAEDQRNEDEIADLFMIVEATRDILIRIRIRAQAETSGAKNV